MKLLYFIACLLIVCCLGCEKNDNNDSENGSRCNNLHFIADSVKCEYNAYNQFLPAKIVKGQRIGTEFDYSYKDSLAIDLDLDSNADIQFNYFMSFYQPQNCDTNIIDACMPSGQAFCNLKLLNSQLEIAIQDDYHFGKSPKVFNSSDTIDSYSNWSTDKKIYIISAAGINNGWDNTDTDNYMGIRIKTNSKYKYAWIRLNTEYSNLIRVFEYCIQK